MTRPLPSASATASQASTGCRRTVRDYERLAEHHETIVYWAMIITMSRRLARQRQTPQPHVTFTSPAPG